MSGRIIQGFFIGGTLRAPAARARPVVASQRRPAPSRPAPSRPAPAHAAATVAQRFGGGSDSFAIDPVQVGLARSGGQPLPGALLAKMEAAFQADFSGVRVHIGPQAARIGAIAFTTGNDLYFAPGQFQPDSVKGQQLIGHELAHVIQQRAGRVRAPGSGVAVVQDRMLEAEADRLGMRAAAHRVAVQARPAPGAMPPAHRADPIQRAVAVSAPEPVGPGRFRLTARDQGRAVGSVMVDVKGRPGAFVTDLGVDASHRDRGVGRMLLAHAARAGMRFGKTQVELAADDKGSGRLVRWYKDMGFTPTGANERRQPVLKAPASGIAAQAKAAPTGPIQRSAAAAVKVPMTQTPAKGAIVSAMPAKKPSTVGSLSASYGKTTFTMTKAEHAEKQLCDALLKSFAPSKNKNQASAAIPNPLAISVDAWPCDKCDQLMADLASQLKTKVVVTIDNDKSGFAANYNLPYGSIGSITY